MKINKVAKEQILNCEGEMKSLQQAAQVKMKELVSLVSTATGEKGFQGYEIKGDEIFLSFPKPAFKEQVKKLKTAKKKK
jgi:hypothetical protein